MATLKNLKKSFSEISGEEQLELIKKIRFSRRQVKLSAKRKKPTAKKKPKTKKDIVSTLSKEQAMKLLKMLEAEKEK